MVTATGTATKLKVDRVSKVFTLRTVGSKEEQKIVALKEATFEVNDHELVALIGQSGCGKTTLLRIIQGLIHNDGGAVYVDGKPVTKPGYDRGVVFQQANLLPWRTARANVEFGLELQGVEPKERRERAMKYLELVNLTEFANHHPHQLSGGMQQRVGLARAFAIDPAIMLMDEPFGALDAQTREILQVELLRIFRETRKTILFVTHDLDEAVYLADRVVVMSARPGRVKESVNIPFPRPRPSLTELKGTKEFLDVRNYIWHSIRPSGTATLE